jgi:tetrahydrodipicolinate N-succinyltransferase
MNHSNTSRSARSEMEALAGIGFTTPGAKVMHEGFCNFNAGTLGASMVEVGCYITGGCHMQMPDGSVMKAKELSGKNGILFRRDSQSGELNAELHKN